LELSTYNTTTELVQKHVTQSHKTLGTYKCIVGAETEQFNKLLEKSTKICNLASEGQFNRQQAWLAYRCCYIPSMIYCLSAVSLNEKQLNNIQTKATAQFTRGCGFELTYPKALVHGPICFGGLGFCHLYVESNVLKIETLICHINKGTSLGEMMKVNLNWVQIHTGINTPFMLGKNHIDYIQDNWFIEICNFLMKCNASIRIKNIWRPQILRNLDKLIMTKINPNTVTKSQRMIINNWRMFFQVSSIAELINYAGDQIRSEFFYKNKQHGYESSTKYRWPKRHIPCSSTFHIWKDYITKITKCDSTRKLQKKLGMWSVNPTTTISIRSWIHKHQKYIVVLGENDLWYKHPLWKINISTAYYRVTNNPVVGAICFDALIPVDVMQEEQFYVVKC
jgi:hypothetical protein